MQWSETLTNLKSVGFSCKAFIISITKEVIWRTTCDAHKAENDMPLNAYEVCTTKVTPEVNYLGIYTTNATPRKQNPLWYDLSANYKNRFQVRTSYNTGKTLATNISTKFQLKGYNQDGTHFVSVKSIGNWIKFVHMNPNWTRSVLILFHSSCWIEHSIQNEMLIWNRVNLDPDFTLPWNSKWNRCSLWPK